uniref:PorV/PorQ family protein n=1 Tax=candidate division WOR-3 bacterium TaxID=2052148 RepID=A0A7C6AAZ9_UNCW3
MLINLILFIINLGYSDIGTSALPLLKIGPGPRATAMGDGFVGLCDDVTALYWNPAGLAQLNKFETFLSHQEWFYGFRDEYISLGLPVGKSSFGFGAVYSRTDGVEHWTINNNPGDTFATQTGFIALGYGYELTRSFLFGITLKGLYDDLRVEKGTGLGGDLGLLFRLGERFNIGLVGKNLGLGVKYGETNYPLPMQFKLGLCLRPSHFNIVSDFTLPLDNIPHLNLGIEWNIKNILALRAGYRTGPQDLTSLGFANGLSFGVGLFLGKVCVDYAFVPYGDLGNTHKFGLRTAIPLPGSGLFKIKVIDARTKRPITACVLFSGIRQETRQSNLKGEAYLEKLNSGWLKLGVTKDGYFPYNDSVFIQGIGEQNLTVELIKLGYGTIWGMVYDSLTKKPIGGIVTYTGQSSGNFNVDTLTGTYTLRDLPIGLYELEVKGPSLNYIPQRCSVYLTYDEVVTKDFYLLRRKELPKFPSIYFKTGSSEISDEAKFALDKAGKILLENPQVMVELSGHCDKKESGIDLWRLSQKRAEAVKKYLNEKFGISFERMQVQGYADTQPFAPSETETGRSLNRRVDFRILKE